MPPNLAPQQRATTMAEVFAVMERFQTDEGRQRGLSFQPNPTDVFISPFAKSGTTWTQQIVHGLRTGGDMNFDEITAVVPWLEMAYDLELDLEAPQPSPRAFKSHLPWHDIPKGGRYIIPIRNPRSVLVSFYHFFEDWWFEAGTIPLATFARELFLSSRRYWQHLSSWWEQRTDENVLLLCYEDMLEDLPAAVRKIATFIDVELDQALLDIVVHQSSLAFMLAHKERFDDHLVREARDAVCGRPPDGDSSKVVDARTEGKQKVPPQIEAELDRIWQEEITAKFSFASYQELREELQKRNG